MKQEQYDNLHRFLRRIYWFRREPGNTFKALMGSTGCDRPCSDPYCSCYSLREKVLATGKTNGCIEV